jgi:hypothetical protein
MPASSRKSKLAALFTSSTLLSACTVGPDYDRTETDATMRGCWERAVTDEMSQYTTNLELGWIQLNNTTLTGLIRHLDLRHPVFRIEP